jgi:hypothetical protein
MVVGQGTFSIKTPEFPTQAARKKCGVQKGTLARQSRPRPPITTRYASFETPVACCVRPVGFAAQRRSHVTLNLSLLIALESIEIEPRNSADSIASATPSPSHSLVHLLGSDLGPFGVPGGPFCMEGYRVDGPCVGCYATDHRNKRSSSR